MTHSCAVVMGTLRADGTLELDEKPALPATRVQVTLRVIQEPSQGGPTLIDVLDQIRANQVVRRVRWTQPC